MKLRTLLLAPLAAVLLSCGGDDPTGGNGGQQGSGRTPAQVQAASGDAQTGTVGSRLATPLTVRVTSAAGGGVGGITVAWAVASGGGAISSASTTTDADGTARTEWTLGTTAGAQQATATVSGLTAVAFSAQATPGDPATLERVSGDTQNGTAGAALLDSLVVRVRDAHGNAVGGATVAWQVTGGGGSIAPDTTRTDAAGLARVAWTLGGAEGAHTATASAGSATASFSAVAAAPGTALMEVQSVSPAMLVPGTTATLTGKGFSATPGANTVTIGGVAAPVTAASGTQLTVTLPGHAAFPCEPTRSVEVRVAAGAVSATRAHPLRVAAQRSLDVGEEIILLDPAEVRCNEIAQPGGRYVVSVFNTSTTLSATSSFQLRGASAAPEASADLRAAAAPAAPRTARRALTAEETREAGAHREILEQNRRLLQRLGPTARSGQTQARRSAAAAALPAVGDTLQLRIPDLDAGDYCASFIPITARVVYVGSRSIVLEDRAAPLAGQMDADYQAVGREFDDRMFPVLSANFGNPLASDPLTDANGRILMVFSKVVNDFGSVAGFVFSGDLFDRTQCASSDRGEIFYATVPTSTASGFTAGTRGAWSWTMRSTIIHEAKHITSFGERLSRGATVWEESWLEESTARVSEELWARSVYGYGQGGNVSHAQSLYCESRPSWAECSGSPLVMRKHLGGLYDYLSSVETLTPLGRAASGDASFYGSGWSLVRWSADHFASSEAAFLTALTQETRLSGVANLSARTGQSFPELLGAWSLALATDDLSGFSPRNARLRFPGWNLRDVYAGLNRDFASSYTLAYPLAPRPVPFGAFAVDVPRLRAGTASLFELSGTPAGGQVIELRRPSGEAPAPTLRIGIVRVQ